MAPINDTISQLTNQELKEKLKEYGINVGPIVSSTRSLYEKKLRKIALGQELKPKYTEVPYDEDSEDDDSLEDNDDLSDDDDDVEEVPPLIMQQDRTPRRRPNVPGSPTRVTRLPEPKFTETPVKSQSTTYSLPPKPKKKEGSDSFPKWLILLVIVILVALGYFIVSNMESNSESNIPTHIEVEV